MHSLLNQRLPPVRIIVTEDGSTDSTAAILAEYEGRYPGLVHVIHTGSTTRDYRRIPSLWNMALDYAKLAGLTESCKYQLIGAGDIALDREYANIVISFMEKNPNHVICSGDYGTMRSCAPHGAGRVIRQSFFQKHYGHAYSAIVGYESEILHRAVIAGYKLHIVSGATYEHLDKLGSHHNFKEFGYAMRALGYSRVYAVARFVNDFTYNKGIGKKGAIQMLASYIAYKPEKEGYYSHFDKELRRTICQQQQQQLISIPIRITKNIITKAFWVTSKIIIKVAGN